MSNNFLRPGECHVYLDDSECGAFTGDVNYRPPYYECDVCGYILRTESDIEGDTDSDFQPGERDGTDGEGEDDELGDSIGTPVDAMVQNDTPEEAMYRDTQKKLREIIDELQQGGGETDVYTMFFATEFDNIVAFYTLFTKYGPFTLIDNPSDKKKKVLETACAYMMMENDTVRFELLEKVTGYKETGLIKEALQFIARYKGEEYNEGAYLIEIYTPSLGLPANFILPMQEVWNEIAHPRGAIRDKVVAFIVAYARESGSKITQVEATKATGVSRSTLSPKIKQYTELLKEVINQS